MGRFVCLVGMLILPALAWAQSLEYRGGDHELLIAPTAYTMPKGWIYLTNYELFFLNAGFAATDRTHVSAFVLFPMIPEFLRTLSIGMKQNYWYSSSFASALWGAYNFELGILAVGNAFSVGTMRSNATFNAILIADLKESPGAGWGFSLGGAIALSSSVKLLGEYWFSGETLRGTSSGEILALGIRFYGKQFCIDLGGIRPVGVTGEDSSDLIAFPYLKGTYIILPEK